jgi:hypothetical protein
MVLQTDQYRSQMESLNFRLGEFLNVRRALNPVEQTEVRSLLDQYKALNNNLQTTLTETGNDTDIGQITTNIGKYQENIKELEQRLKEVKQELDTSEARKRSVERVEQDVSYHQLYVMDRPLRQLSIPTLFTISIVFVFAGIYFLYRLWTYGATPHVTAAHGASHGWTGLLGSSGAHLAAPAGHGKPANTGGISAILPSFNLSGIGLSSLWGR